MSKNQISLNLGVEIKRYVPTKNDIEDYIKNQRLMSAKTPNASLTMNQYLKDRYFADEPVVVTADLSNRVFGKDGTDKVTDQITDLSGGDFTGCILKNTLFQGCDLAEAVFCDVDFDNALFKDTKLTNIDFRGADLSNCRFSENYKDYEQLGKRADIAGIKYSVTSSLGRRYADVKSDLVRQKEQKELIESKRRELDEAYKKLSYKQAAYQIGGYETGNPEYDQLNKELKVMTEEKKFSRKNDAMHETFQNIFASEASSFDPAYVRGSSKERRDEKKMYVRVTRKLIEEYVNAVKNTPQLNLNDYVRVSCITSEKDKKEAEGKLVIADCSSKAGVNNEWFDRLDLSGLDFSKADLSGAVFAGSDLSGCKFHETNINEASFESAAMKSADFKNVTANNTNFFNCDLSNSTIDDSQFPHAFMARSNGQEIKVNRSNFDYANIKNGQWDEAKLTESTFQHANLEGLSLISAKLRQVQMQHAILDKAVLTECEIVESDLSNVFLREAKAQKAKFVNTVLQEIEAKKIDLTEVELDSFTKLDGANLEAAILRKIKAEGVSFVKANMDMVEAQQANLKEAVLTEANIRFADLTDAILEGTKAQGINASYSVLERVKAQKADFSNAIMMRIQGQQADFTEVNFTDCDLTRSKLQLAILEKVQAEKAKLEGVDLQKAKLAEANLAKATVDEKTNLVGADISGIKGPLIIDGKEITPQQLQTQVAAELAQKKNEPGRFEQVGTSLLSWFDLLKIIGPALGGVTELPSLYNNFREFQKTSQALLSDKLLIGERQKLQKKRVEQISNLIEGASHVLGKMPNSPQSDLVKDALAKYVAFPVLGAVINPAPMISLTEARRINPDIFEGVSKEFGRELVPVLLNLVRSALEDESAKRIQDICREALIPSENSGNKIVDNAVEILVNPKLVKIIKDELAPFLKAPDNQREITKVVENVLEAKFTRAVPKELLTNTVSVVTDISSDILANIPEIVTIGKAYGHHQKYSVELLTSEELSDQRKETLLKEQKLEIRNILDKSEEILANMSANLWLKLPEYLTKNSKDILSVLQAPEIQRRLENYGLDPEFVHEAAKATMPFITDMLPIITDLAKNSLQNKEGLGKIIEQFTGLMNSPKSEQQNKIGNLTSSLIDFKNNNLKVKDILQKRIPNLLIQHAETLGPVVEKFLVETEIGKKLKLKGEKLLEVLGEHSKDVGEIVAQYNKGQYRSMIWPVWKLLTDKKVLDVVAKSLVNLAKYNFQKNLISNFTREKIIGKKMNQFMSDILPAETNKRQDLSAIFQRESEKQSESLNPSSVLVYSLENKDLTGLSFKETNLQLSDFEIKGFNFDKTELGKGSFKGSVLKGCSFNKTSLEEPIEFDGAVIDGKTLSSLLPTIDRYNKKHPKKPMKLDKIKVVGEISEKIKGSPLLKGANFDEAKVIALKGPKEQKTKRKISYTASCASDVTKKKNGANVGVGVVM
jgi:uncharacterized protein YjbI with pentapeptide repeats